MTDIKTKVQAEVRKQLPHLMELGFGCRVRYPSHTRYASCDELDNPQFTEATVTLYAEEKGYDDSEEFFYVWNDWNEIEDLSGKLSEDELEIIGHPPRLNNYLAVLVKYAETLDPDIGDGYISFIIGEGANDFAYKITFNLKKGEPATEEDWRTYAELIGLDV